MPCTWPGWRSTWYGSAMVPTWPCRSTEKRGRPPCRSSRRDCSSLQPSLRRAAGPHLLRAHRHPSRTVCCRHRTLAVRGAKRPSPRVDRLSTASIASRYTPAIRSAPSCAISARRCTAHRGWLGERPGRTAPSPTVSDVPGNARPVHTPVHTHESGLLDRTGETAPTLVSCRLGANLVDVESDDRRRQEAQRGESTGESGHPPQTVSPAQTGVEQNSSAYGH